MKMSVSSFFDEDYVSPEFSTAGVAVDARPGEIG
jgi:hypothetical protein